LIKTNPNDRVSRLKPLGGLGTKHFRYGGTTPKLNESQVKEIKMMLSDPDIMKKFRSITEAYQEIGKAYDVTGCAISNIARGIAWKHVKV
jgi:transposase